MVNKKAEKLRLVISLSCAAFLFLLIGVGFVPHSVKEDTIFTVARGENIFSIGARLEDQDIVTSRFWFWAWGIALGRWSSLRAGDFVFEGSVSVIKAINIIAGRAGSEDVVVLIPEGFRAGDITDRLKEIGFINFTGLSGYTPASLVGAYPFLQAVPHSIENVEGFLFPDTYRFSPTASNQDVLEKFLENFGEQTKEVRAETERRGINFYELLILASILEREVPVEDMPRAAGVLTKRLNAGMPLQVDATLVYALGRPLKFEDIERLNSPYNTYKVLGLPPTPIANPGLAALSAALNPEENSYWFYLSRRDNGRTIFSRTFAEHTAARNAYLK